MKKKLLLALMVLYVVLDLGYTFVQSYQLPLEGDLPSIVLPDAGCQYILQDPFGWAVLSRDSVYVGPNRFFAHAGMVSYFKTVPFALQRVTDPISSLYAACALFGVGVQALLLYLLGVYITGSYQLSRRSFWLAVVLLVPLFQTAGYNDQMGIIDYSITYTFFYAFPMALLALLLLPFYLAAARDEPLRLNWLSQVALIGLMVVLAFNGAIITGVVAVLVFGVVMHWLLRQRQAGARFGAGQWREQLRRLPRQPMRLLGLFVVLCLYSLYIGLNEQEKTGHELALFDRYLRIPSGIFWMLRKLGLPLLILALVANAQLIRRRLPATPESRRILRVLRWVGLFALVYVLLLPLGGYRDYRPLIVRRDSVLPALLGLFFCYGLTTLFLLRHLAGRLRRWYIAGVVVFSGIFINADRLWLRENNTCERAGMERLAQATEPVVRLSAECTVMSWWKINDPQYSDTQAQLFEYWGVTKGKKRYYHEGW